MLAWILRLVIIFAILTAVYLALRWYMRWLRRHELESEYVAEDPPEDRADYIARGLRNYDRSLKPKLALGVYFVPLLFIIVLLVLANNS